MDEENKASYYAVIPANVRYDKDITANAKLLYGEIAALCHLKGYCWSTNKYFSQLYGVSKETISRWISKLAEKGYIKTYVKYRDGTKEVAERMISVIDPIDKNINTYTQKAQDPIDEKRKTPIDEKRKDNNTRYNNTINNMSCKQDGADIEEIINHLNQKVGSSYRATTNKTKSMIKARYREGFTKEDFFTVIDRKSKEWTGTKWEKFLRPETLFGGKFEGYLNQKSADHEPSATSTIPEGRWIM